LMIFDASPRLSAHRIEGLWFRGPLAPRLDPPPVNLRRLKYKVCQKRDKADFVYGKAIQGY